jgi:peptide/nickel transport system permease protein
LTTYVFKRLLLMVPTLFGISLVLWLILLAAPGRPGGSAAAFGEQKGDIDPTKELEKDESQRLFRSQYGLDRPVFWNGWTSLSADEVGRTIDIERAPIETVGVRRKREAREQLQDWGTYAVPGLVALLSTTDGERQDAVLKWLRLNATRRVVLDDDAATLARNREIAAENAEIATFKWKPDDAAEVRRDVVAKWRTWFESHRDRWSWTGWQKVKTGLLDTQFGTYWARLLRFDLGRSYLHKRPVLEVIAERMPVTVALSLVAILIVYALAIPLGIWSAVRPYTLADRSLSVGLFLLYSLPSFFVGTVLLRALTIDDPVRWFPTSDLTSSGAADRNSWERLKDVLWHSTLPIVVMTYGGLASLSRFSRTGMLDVIRSDYVRTARAKGLDETSVVLRHAARNGMMPMITLLAGILPGLVGGSVIVEYLFNIKGMGMLVLEAINNRDYNVVIGEALIIAVLTQIGILISDVLYAVVDPRVSYR